MILKLVACYFVSVIPAHNVVVELPGMYIPAEGNSLLLSVEYFQRFGSVFIAYFLTTCGTYVSEITASRKSACAWLAVC